MRRARPGPAAERRIAELVATGASNTAIADQLILSRRTVETHISRILAKLQVRSRAEIAARLTPDQPR